MTVRRPVATGYVDLGSAGLTELRIHGVGGTSPQELLDHPHPVQVAGDATSGFYRRWDADARDPATAAGDHHVEGFCWGGLTSGSARRALWLLLIPFLLVNVAHWALPGRAAQRRWANTAAQRLIRLLALSLTMTLVVAAAETGIDLLGRQCAGSSCFKSAPSWLSSLAGHRAVLVCLGALIPLATIALVGLLGRSTWKVTEKVDPRTDAQPPAAPEDPALADPRFWAGAEPVRRLWAVHLASGLAVASVIQVLPVLDSPRRAYAVATLVVAGLILATSAVLAAGDGVARQHHRPLLQSDLSRWAPVLTWAAAAVFAASLLVDLLPHAVPAATGVGHELRRLDGLVQALFGLQALVVVLLAVFAVAAGLQPAAVLAGRRRAGDKLIAPALAVVAWLMAWFFAAGLTVRVAQQLFGSAKGAVPAAYLVFGALIAPGGGLILVGVAIAVFCWYRAEASRQRALLSALPPPAGPAVGATPEASSGRIAALASVRTRAGILDIAPQLAVGATAAGVVLAIVGVVLARFSRHLVDRHWIQQLADLGTLLLGLAILRLLAVAKQAWQQAKMRRSVGILWDLGTFWPRAAHPLAPPCYCERALPQLHTRLAHCGARREDDIVLAAHSQGTVIAAALLLMPRGDDVAARISLLTYGSPLGRLYARVFPGYLGPQVLGAASSGHASGVGAKRADSAKRADAGAASPDGTEIAGGVAAGRGPLTVRSQSSQWLNLYRGTDPIGGYIDVPDAGTGRVGQPFGVSGAIRTGAIDVVLVDPEFDPGPGDLFAPAPAGHSHYREDATYDEAISELTFRPLNPERKATPL